MEKIDKNESNVSTFSFLGTEHSMEVVIIYRDRIWEQQIHPTHILSRPFMQMVNI